MSTINLVVGALNTGPGLTISGLTLAVDTANSVTVVGNAVQLVNDTSLPGALRYYGTDAVGIKGWFSVTGEGGSTGVGYGAGTGIYIDSNENINVNSTVATAASVTTLTNYSNSTFATLVSLTQTGATLYNDLIGASGQFNTNFATAANLATTGSNLYKDINGMSGWVNSTFGTLANLAATGSNLYSYITNLSGAFNTTLGAYATVANLQSTGSTLYGYITAVSGADAGIYATITNLYTTGHTLYGDIVGLSGVTLSLLAATGSALYNDLNNMSGVFNAALGAYATLGALANTGQQAWTAAQNNSTNLSGNLTQTGISLIALINGAHGGVSSLNGLSGTLAINSSGFITFQTGAGAITLGTTGLATSVGLQLTGSNLYSLIIGMSGANGTTYATIGNLSLTGSQLYSDIVGMSGWANSTFATIANLATTNTNLSITGSTLYQDLTGMSGWANATFATVASLAASGSRLYNYIVELSGAFNTTLGSYATVANLTQTGITLEAQLAALSGWAASAVSLGATGSQLYSDLIGFSGTYSYQIPTIYGGNNGPQIYAAPNQGSYLTMLGNNNSGNFTGYDTVIGNYNSEVLGGAFATLSGSYNPTIPIARGRTTGSAITTVGHGNIVGITGLSGAVELGVTVIGLDNIISCTGVVGGQGVLLLGQNNTVKVASSNGFGDNCLVGYGNAVNGDYISLAAGAIYGTSNLIHATHDERNGSNSLILGSVNSLFTTSGTIASQGFNTMIGQTNSMTFNQATGFNSAGTNAQDGVCLIMGVENVLTNNAAVPGTHFIDNYIIGTHDTFIVDQQTGLGIDHFRNQIIGHENTIHIASGSNGGNRAMSLLGHYNTLTYDSNNVNYVFVPTFGTQIPNLGNNGTTVVGYQNEGCNLVNSNIVGIDNRGNGNNLYMYGQSLFASGSYGRMFLGFGNVITSQNYAPTGPFQTGAQLQIIDCSGAFLSITGNWTNSGVATIAQLLQASGAAALGSGASIAGSNGWIQYNQSGLLGANSGFTGDLFGNITVNSLGIGTSARGAAGTILCSVISGFNGNFSTDIPGNIVANSINVGAGSIGSPSLRIAGNGGFYNNGNFGISAELRGDLLVTFANHEAAVPGMISNFPIIPNTDTGSTITLGSPTYRWAKMFSGPSGLQIGNGTFGGSISSAGSSPHESIIISAGLSGGSIILNSNSGIFSSNTGNWVDSGIATIAQLMQVSGAGGGGGTTYSAGTGIYIDGTNHINALPVSSTPAFSGVFNVTGPTYSGALETFVTFSGGSNITYSLPSAASLHGRQLIVKQCGSGQLSINAVGGDIIFDSSPVSIITGNGIGFSYTFMATTGMFYTI